MNQITALAPVASSLVMPGAPPLANSLLNFVAHAMTDPAVNVDKLEALLRMQRDITAADARLQFNRAMSQTQAEMQPVVRDASNSQTQSRYARLETIDAVIRPIYTRNGFCLSFDSEPVEGGIRVVCEVSHDAGHAKTYQLEAALDMAGPRGNANKTPLHALGSSVSYLRRYLTCMIFHVVLANEDTDGNRAPPPTPPSRPHIDELYALLAECSFDPAEREANERSFLSKMGLAGLRSLADAPAGDIPRLRNALLTKKGIIQQRRQLAIQQAQQAEAARKARAPQGEAA